MAKSFYTNSKDGLFYDGQFKLAPGQTAEVEEGKETPKMLQAFRSGWLNKTTSKPSDYSPGNSRREEEKEASGTAKKPADKK